jgi:hypothetical protein
MLDYEMDRHGKSDRIYAGMLLFLGVIVFFLAGVAAIFILTI